MNKLIHAGIIFVLMILTHESLGANLYKYKDKNGRWVMTDKPPQESLSSSIEKKRLVFTEKSQSISVVNRGNQDKPQLYGVNQTAGPVEVWIEFSKRENLRISQKEPFYWVLPPNRDLFLLNLEPKSPKKSWAYQWSYHFVPGAPMDPEKLAKLEFDLPFRGGRHPISQGFMGEASHKQHVQSHYAIDITMPNHTAIVAVDSGIVMEVERNFSRSGWSEEYADEANYVRLLHANGVMTVYAHLEPDSLEVVVGQTVKRGQLLGYSGTTGFSSGPHLHFVVQVNQGKQLISLPFQFRGFSDNPKVGDVLTAGDYY
jgi:murein DD-endopeptidase MepM/ murein hydrolase activator NlpD